MNNFNCLLIKVALLTFFINGCLSLKPSIEWPSECSGQDICSTKVKLSQEILDGMKKVMSVIKMKGLGNNNTMHQKIGQFDESESHGCKVTRGRFQPFLIRDDQQSKVYPVFQTKFFNQYIHTEECSIDYEEDSSDRHCFDSELTVEKSKCRTYSANIYLYVYDIEKKSAELLSSSIHVCCKCEID